MTVSSYNLSIEEAEMNVLELSQANMESSRPVTYHG